MRESGIDLMREWLNALGWIACSIYATIPSFWFLVHPRVEYWRSRRRAPYRVLLPAWIGMWIVAGAVTFRWRHVALYSVAWTWVPAVLLFAAGFWVYSRSGKGFSAKQLGGLPEVMAGHPEQRLVTTGIRARVRHPVYLAHLCEMTAWSIGTGLVVCSGLTAFAIITGAIMIGMEERELRNRFGAEHAAYMKDVPAVIPRFTRAKKT